MATEQLLSLVDYIAYTARCMEITDLHRIDYIQKRRALYGLARVKEDTYPLKEWNDAIDYIVGLEPVGTISEARAALERFLSDEKE